jgi:hypothetical protein
MPAATPISGGINPPPTGSIAIESDIRTKGPFLLRMRVATHVVITDPKMIVTIPDTSKLGISVIAGCWPSTDVIAGQAAMKIPFDDISP